MAGVNADEHLLLYTFAAIWRSRCGRAFNFAVLQWAFLIFDEESLRRDNQRSSSFRETVGDRLGGIAEQLDESGQGARVHVVHVGAGVERRDFDAARPSGASAFSQAFVAGLALKERVGEPTTSKLSPIKCPGFTSPTR